MGAFGQVFGSQIPKVVYAQFNFEQFAESTVLAGNDITNPVLLVEYIETVGPSTVSKIPVLDARITAVGIKDSGVGQIRLSILRSQDGGVTWINVTQMAFTSGVFAEGDLTTNDQNIGLDNNRYALGLINTDGISTGRVKEIRGDIIFKLPLNHTLAEV